MTKNSYTNIEDKILKDNASNHTNKELQEMLLQVGRARSISSIQNRKNKLGLKCSFNAGQFKKGQISFNKGKTWDEYMSEEGQENSRKTTFKKGNIPDNYRPVGSERISVYGYAEIKVADPNVWELKHRYIYKQHYGKIPDGYNVMFADKNRQNFDIDNLILVSKSEDLIMNRNELFFEDKELTKSGHLIAKVIDKTYKRRKEK